MSRMKQITVLPDDMEKGKPFDCSHCALALAVRRAFQVKDPRQVAVCHEAILLKAGTKYDKGELGYTHLIYLPTKVRGWVRNFDRYYWEREEHPVYWEDGFRFTGEIQKAPIRLNLTAQTSQDRADQIAEIQNTIEILGDKLQ
tara:strand:+ start:129 stop:557 length:429 start_codon:yes stop_codon:yes gene_type:complete